MSLSASIVIKKGKTFLFRETCSQNRVRVLMACSILNSSSAAAVRTSQALEIHSDPPLSTRKQNSTHFSGFLSLPLMIRSYLTVTNYLTTFGFLNDIRGLLFSSSLVRSELRLFKLVLLLVCRSLRKVFGVLQAIIGFDPPTGDSSTVWSKPEQVGDDSLGGELEKIRTISGTELARCLTVVVEVGLK